MRSGLGVGLHRPAGTDWSHVPFAALFERDLGVLELGPFREHFARELVQLRLDLGRRLAAVTAAGVRGWTIGRVVSGSGRVVLNEGE